MTVFRRHITGEYAQRAAKTSCAAADHSRWRGRSGWTAAPRGAVPWASCRCRTSAVGESAVWKARKAMLPWGDVGDQECVLGPFGIGRR